MPPGDDSAYFVDDDGTFAKHSFSTGANTSVTAEEAAPAIIHEAMLGMLSLTISSPDAPLGSGNWSYDPSPNTLGIADAEGAAYSEIFARPSLTEDQKYEAVHRVLGDNPTVVKVGYDMFGPDIATRIWGPSAANVATMNSSDRPADGAPSTVIQNSQTQGVGPLAGDSAVPADAQVNAAGPAAASTGAGQSALDTHGQGTASTPRADPKTGGDPVLLASGQLFVQVTDLEVRGRGLHLAFRRTYLHQASYRGPVGASWDHCYNLWLREAQELQPDGSIANVIYRSNGEVREDRYDQANVAGATGPLDTVSDATFRGPPGFFDELTKRAGVYRLRMVNGTVITYGPDLKVESITDRSGNALTFEYDAGLLVRITDSVGKVFDFVNDEHGRITEILDRTGGRRLAYAYDDVGNLVESDVFADDAASSTDYVYIGADGPPGFEHNLVEVIGPDGNATLSVAYGSDTGLRSYNRVTEQRMLDGAYQYEYDVADLDGDPGVAPMNRARSLTTVTYPNGHVVEHAFNSQGNVVRRTEDVKAIAGGLDGVDTLVARYAYDGDGLLVSEERSDGATVSYRYEVEAYEELNGDGSAIHAPVDVRLRFGNLLRRSETARAGTGETRQIVTTWTYVAGDTQVASQRGPYYADPGGVEIPGQETPAITYGYDALGRLVQIDCGTVATADGSTQALPPTRIAYDAHGSPTDVRGGSVRTHYDYFPDALRSGFVAARVEDADGVGRITTFEVDALGRITRSQDAFGAQFRWEYDGFDLVVKATFPPQGALSPVVDVRYDRARRVTRLSESIVRSDGTPHPDGGLVHGYRYDRNGRLVETTSGPLNNPAARRERTIFTPWGQPRRRTDAAGAVTELAYDARNLPSRLVLGSGTGAECERRFRYDRSGELVAVTDGAGNAIAIERDGFGRPGRVVNRDGTWWELTYDAADRVVRRRRVAPSAGGGPPVTWSETRLERDAAGRLIRRIDVLFAPTDPTVPRRELVTRYAYDECSRLAEVRDPAQGFVRFAYDGLGRVTEVRDGDGNLERREYDDLARRMTTVRAEREQGSASPRFEWFRRTVTFDARGRLVAEEDGVGNATERALDSGGRVERMTLPGGRVASYRYDVFGQLVEQELASGRSTEVAHRQYDAMGRLSGLDDAGGEHWSWTYDARGRLASATGHGGTCSFEYGVEGPVRAVTLASGLRFLRTYSPEGLELTASVDASAYAPPAGAPGYAPVPAAPIAYGYTPLGDLARVDQAGQGLRFAYDSLGRRSREATLGSAVAFEWDDGGRLSELTFPSGRKVAYAYTPAGYLRGIVQVDRGSAYPGDPAAAVARPLVDVTRVGPRPRSVDAHGILQSSFTYDAARRLAGIDYRAAGAPVDSVRALHGGTGALLVSTRGSSLRGFEYDDLGRLRRATDRVAGPLDIAPVAPASDEGQVAAVVQQPAITALASAAVAAAGPVRSEFEYALDAGGNRVTSAAMVAAPGPTVVTTYAAAPGARYAQVNGVPAVYDRDGNLISDGVRTFRYDVFGRLRTVEEAGTVTSAEYDPLGRVTRIATGGAVRELTWAGSVLIGAGPHTAAVQLVPGDRLDGPMHVAADGREVVPVADGVGSVLGWVGAGGAAIGNCSYDPFGRVVAQAGLEPAPLGFAGQIRAPGTDLYWMRARVYDARLGRFLQPDPLGLAGGLNVYGYAHDAPGSFVDPLGFASTQMDWGSVAWEATKTIGVGVGVVAVSAGLVSAGFVSAPFVLAVGGLVMVRGGLASFIKRSDEAFAAGQTDPAGAVALAAAGDMVGVTNIIEGATGRDAVTDRALGTEERSARLGTGIGTVGTLVLGPKAAKIGGAAGASVRGPIRLAAPPAGALDVVVKEGQPVVQLPELNIDVRPPGAPTSPAYTELPVFVKGGRTSAATLGGPVVQSGMNGPYEGAAAELWKFAGESGLPLRPNFRDRFPNFGVQGGYITTHAEIKALYADPAADFVEVNNDPCLGCRGAISWLAAARARPHVLLAPSGFFYFLPDGTVIAPNGAAPR